MKNVIFMMTKVNTFLSPNKIILGNGAIKYLGEEIRKLGAGKALIVTDEGVIKAGLVELRTSEKLSKRGFTITEAELSPHRIVRDRLRFSQSGFTSIGTFRLY